MQRALEVVGRTPQEEFQTLEQWIVGNHAYVTSAMAGRLWVYDISNPAAPLKVDSLTFDARIINDVSTTADGKVTVISREGASNRKNGIVFLDTSDPAHPKVVSEYTETVTGGVHSAFVDGHYVYLTDDATGSMRVIDFRDVKSPREVGRWEPDRQDAEVPQSRRRRVHRRADAARRAGEGRSALRGVLARRLDRSRRRQRHQRRQPGEAGASSASSVSTTTSSTDRAGSPARTRCSATRTTCSSATKCFPRSSIFRAAIAFPVQGIVHVVDVSDIEQPRKVAKYEVPEGGAHNVWVEDDVMYMGYYNGGARVVDVSGELRGDLYRQGREIARLWTGRSEGLAPESALLLGRAAAQRPDLFQRHQQRHLDHEATGSAQVAGRTPAPSVAQRRFRPCIGVERIAPKARRVLALEESSPRFADL